MFQKAHYLFTLLCGGSTAAIAVFVSLLYLHVSESNLRENQFRSFQNDINTITASLENSPLVSIQWLAQLEAQSGYRIYVTDNGVPFLYNSLHRDVDQYSQSLLTESLYAYHDMHETVSSVAAADTYSGIQHTEYRFVSSTLGEAYYSSLIDIRGESTSSQIVILCSQQALDSQISKQRLRFLEIDCCAAILLFAFAWFFTGRLLKPLRENHETQTRFIAAASHELRTPLSVILASSECCESASAEEQKGFFRTIRKEGRRMHHLIDDMLTLTHSGANRFPIICSDVQLDTLCLNAYEAFESLCRGRGLSLRLILPEEVPPRCYCDADRITQVLSILLHNALSYTPDGGQITLTLRYHPAGSRLPYYGKSRFFRKNSSCFEIIVADTGIGIPDEDKKHVFDRFYRVEKSRSTKEHFGLGLSIAYEIVAAHHGRISVKDNPGGGSMFKVCLACCPRKTK